MNIKPYLTAILIMVAFLFSGFSCNAQNSPDTIRIAKEGLNYVYYKNNEELTFTQVMALTASNPKAHKLLAESKSRRNSSYIAGIAGGALAGYALGSLVGSAISGNPINEPVFYSTLIAGTIFVGIAFGLNASANFKTECAVEIFNKSQKENNNPNLNLGFSPTCVNLKLIF